MRGQILQVSESGGGIIAGSDGNRYTFGRSDWRGPSAPTAGTEVGFIAATNTASEIFPLPSRASATSSASAATGSTVVIAPGTNQGSSQLLGVIGILLLLLGFVVPLVPTIA